MIFSVGRLFPRRRLSEKEKLSFQLEIFITAKQSQAVTRERGEEEGELES
jgi:hypothetical protein